MLSMIIDYVQYNFQIGRYGSKHLPKSFCGNDLEQLWMHLRAGDVLFVFTPNSVLSWIVMYVTNEPFSHVALYAGNGKVSHMTTAGYSVDDVSIFIENRCKIVPLVAPIEASDREKFRNAINTFAKMPYGWHSTIGKGLRIFFGRDYPRFKLKFVGDVIFALCVLDLFALSVANMAFFYWLSVPYFVVLARNIYAFKTGNDGFDFVTGAHIFHGMRESGGRQIFNYGEVGEQPSTLPSVITTDMYVFFNYTNFPSKSSIEDQLSKIGGSISFLSTYSIDAKEIDYLCRLGQIEGHSHSNIAPYSEQAERLGYGGSNKFTHSLSVNSSVDTEDVIASVAFACAFAKASDGVFHNPGLHMSIFPTIAIEVGNDIISTLKEIIVERERKANE